MRTTVLIFTMLAAIALPSCRKKPVIEQFVVSGDYFIYGRSGGFTPADAKTTYHIVCNGEERKDMTQSYQSPPQNIADFNFHYRYPTYSYELVADILYRIPQEMLDRNHETIGTYLPDAGYSDIRASINGVDYTWKVEASVDSESQAIIDFMNTVRIDFDEYYTL